MRRNNHKHLLNRYITFISVGLLAVNCNGHQQAKKKPNLLFIWTDEQRTNTMAAYGNKIIKTPNLDRLASESFVFQNTEAGIRELIARYWGLVSQVDQSVGRILNKLKESGLDDNTIVVFTSDHGDMMGAHLMVEKLVMFEEAVRVPFLLKVPFINKEPKTIKRRVSQIDIVPTLIDLLGGITPDRLQGKSLVPLIKGEKVKDDYIFIEWNPDLNYMSYISKNTKMATAEAITRAGTSSSRAVISPDGWKLCLSEKDKNQLYDLNKDSLETTNLYYNPGYKEKIGNLYEKIREWQIQTGDTIKVKPDFL